MGSANDLLIQEAVDRFHKTVSTEDLHGCRPDDNKLNPAAVPPPLYPHAGHSIPVSTLINMINKKNFNGEPVTIYLNGSADVTAQGNRDNNNDHIIYRPALPMPCVDTRLECRWAHDANTPAPPHRSMATGFSFSEGEYTYSIIAPAEHIDATGVCFELSDVFCYAEKTPGKRQAVYITIHQSQAMALAVLTGTGNASLQCKVLYGTPHSHSHISPGAMASITIANQTHTLFRGNCRITAEYGSNTYELKLHWNGPPRFPSRQYRSPRRELTPAPRLCFCHPLTGRPITLDIVNLSGSGLSAKSAGNLIMPPGMIVPRMTLYFANAFKADITAQIIYRKRTAEGSSMQYSFAIIDMDADSHSRYLSLLKLADGALPMISDIAINMDDLWSFFFETGFIYPKKYLFLGKNKQRFRETYEQLYQKHLGFSRHFLLHECGQVLAHLSMLRLYTRSWMMHHHASREASRMAGIAVLKEAGGFINDSCRIQSVNMDYILCYYRPNNKFPRQVFGRLSEITPVTTCSEDTFGYFIHHIGQSGTDRIPRAWRLTPATGKTLTALEDHYRSVSGGLMIDALDLSNRVPDTTALEKQFSAIGLTRAQHLFSLKKHDTLKAVFMVNLSDPCLNMSGLAHCIHVFVLDGSNLTETILKAMLTRLLMHFGQSEMPVLISCWGNAPPPVSFSKQYCLWILNLDHADDYFQHVNRIFRFTRTETTASIITV